MSDPTQRPDLAHDDLSLGGIGGFGVALIVLTVVAAILMWWVSVFLRDLEAAKDPAPPALAEASAPYVPPGPRLQAYPEAELEELRVQERRILESYVWVDKAEGVAQVPIDRAIELLVESRP